MKYQHIHSSDGFTLIEILISVLILSIGLLGLAGLQGLAVKYNTDSYMNTQATMLFREMTGMIRANPLAIGDYAGLDCKNPPAQATVSRCVEDEFPSITMTQCNPSELARYDAFRWCKTIASRLPQANGKITVSGGTVELAVSWLERVSRNEDASGLMNKQVKMSFKP